MVNAVATIELYTFASWPRLGLHWMHSLCGAVTNFHLPPSPGWKKKAREHFRLTRKMRHYKKFKQFRLHSEEEPNINLFSCFCLRPAARDYFGDKQRKPAQIGSYFHLV